MPSDTETVKYYKYIEPAAPYPPPSNQLYAFEHKNFLVTRSDAEYLLWTIKTKENGKPPVFLRGAFTNQTKARAHIDDFWLQEERKKEAAEKVSK